MMRDERRWQWAALVFVFISYLVVAGAYAIKTPKWNNPDEPAHFNYVRHVATTLTLPVLKMGDYDQDYLERLKPLKFPDSLPVDSIRYESHQPPLYYLLAAPIYSLSQGSSLDRTVLALRGFSIALGGLLLFLVFGTAREALPQSPYLAPGAAAVGAGIPMHAAMTAAINNDTLAEVVLTGSLWLMLRGLRRGFDRRLCLALGGLLGLALLTKITIYIALPLALLAMTGRWVLARRSRASYAFGVGAAGTLTTASPAARRDEPLWRQVTMVYGVALLVSAWWFVRNALTYGWNDPFGLVRHDAIVIGQPRTQLTLAALEYLLGTTFQSFWGQFGWMGIVLDRRLYYAAGVLSAVAVAGLVLYVWRVRRQPSRLEPLERWALLLLATTVLLVVAAFIYYNLSFVQAQGRYLFPAIAAISLFIALGVAEVTPRALSPAGLLAVYLGLLAMNYLSLTRSIAPYFGTL